MKPSDYLTEEEHKIIDWIKLKIKQSKSSEELRAYESVLDYLMSESIKRYANKKSNNLKEI